MTRCLVVGLLADMVNGMGHRLSKATGPSDIGKTSWVVFLFGPSTSVNTMKFKIYLYFLEAFFMH
jgi:hypothetical protein